MSYLFTITLLFLISFQATAQEWKPLFDANMSQWESYLSYRHDAAYDGTAPKDSAGNVIPPIGVGNGIDDFGVFTIAMQDNQPVLRVSGEIYGAVTTLASFRNYRFKVQFRWGDKKWPPREALLKDSGILYHAQGAHGQEYYRSWMLSQEFQIMQGHIGDYWSQATSAIDIRAYLPEYVMNPVADESQPFISVGENQPYKGFVLRKENAEKPQGEWNTLELITYEGKSLHIVNGKVVMVLKNSRYVEDGKAVPLDEGKIQLQSEAAEIYYRAAAIQQLDTMPEQYQRYFQ
ncbi:DUF1080 domain-containing protein [Alteromonas pelagimontana]|uniref:DUF1080 domain-containing protein n=1 Tax=Alteromonas pelagimontana TaxID=1858656 RepID=A0A6M4MB95_9ALTE|nr:DUF1080 domain-containing protein [Alteromonas pelagimontana]QJR80078.1 DUF1080 domain-containing protein [Alteromonas pelagimontana]